MSDQFPMRPPGLGVSSRSYASSGPEAAAGGATSHLLPHIWSRFSSPPHSPSDLPHYCKPALQHLTAAMDHPCFSLPLQDDSFLFDCQFDKSCEPLAFDPTSDSGYFSACSSLSPTSSVDSFSFSPASLSVAARGNISFDDLIFFNAEPSVPNQETKTKPCSVRKKSRSRYPGKKRQTASEREKLRMRDLTKAMHHLRTYLPPSVAPAGQMLTKIETLRLTIRYISYLSAQLGLSEEALEQRKPFGFGTALQTLGQFVSQPAAGCSAQEPDFNTINAAQLDSLQSSHLVFTGASFNSESYWVPQQQQELQQQQPQHQQQQQRYAAFTSCC